MSNQDVLIHLRVPAAIKARWVRESRAAGAKLTDWIIDRVERREGIDMLDKINEAIRTHGAQAVYKAAIKRMDGDRTALAAVGLQADNLGQADQIMSAAFRQLGPAAQAIDKASAQAALDGGKGNP